MFLTTPSRISPSASWATSSVRCSARASSRMARRETTMLPRGRSILRMAKGCSLPIRSEEHTSELQSRQYLVCRLLLEKKILLISVCLLSFPLAPEPPLLPAPPLDHRHPLAPLLVHYLPPHPGHLPLVGLYALLHAHLA